MQWIDTVTEPVLHRLSLRGRSPSPLWWEMQVGETSFEFGVDAQGHKSPAYGGRDHGAWARLTANW